MMNYIGICLISISIGAIAIMFCEAYNQKRFDESMNHLIPSLIGTVMLSGLIGIDYWYQNLGLYSIILRIPFLAGLIYIAVTDQKTFLIPNFIVFCLAIYRISGEVLYCRIAHENFSNNLSNMVFGAFMAAITFVLARSIVGKRIGMGDIKLITVVGLYLGEYVLSAIILSLVSALVIELISIARKKHSLKQEFSFGPYISFGTIALLVLGV